MKVPKRIKAKALIMLFLFVFLGVSAMADGGQGISGAGGVLKKDRVRTTLVTSTGYVYFQYVPVGTTTVQDVVAQYNILKDEYKQALERSEVTKQLEIVVEENK